MCPVCRQLMATLEFESTNVEHCVRCEGTWIDSGEIRLLGAFDRTSLEHILAAFSDAPVLGRTGRRCPRCPRYLREIALGSEPKLIVDRCPWGHGIWFDRGEMLNLIRAFGGDRLGPAAQFFSSLYRAAPTEGGDK